MKKRIAVFVLLLSVLFTTFAQALVSRANVMVPSLSFNSTTASCVVAVIANSDDDEITVEAELLEDGDPYRNWTGYGTGSLNFRRTASVRKGHTYTFSAEVTIDGETYSTRPITKTFN